jgi:starch-binding outer membrane protein, SusD/RagB family
MNLRLTSGRASLVIMAAALATVSCTPDLTVPSFNNPSVDQILDNPGRQGIAAAAQGLLRGTRAAVVERLTWTGALGREGYPMAASGSSLPGIVRDPLDGSSFPGTAMWSEPYRNIRNANLLLGALDGEDALTEAEKNATRGFAKTIQAYDYLALITSRGRLGIPFDIPTDPGAEPAPVLAEAQVYERISALLDDALANLNQGGAAFPFRVHSGLGAFSTPQTFARLNRALKARTEMYRRNWSGVLTALDQSFTDPTGPLSAGAFHPFSTASGDAVNTVFNPGLYYAHPRLRSEAQLRADGSLDRRASEKTRVVPEIVILGVRSNVQFTTYSSGASPIPWVKNEELILMRAEARLQLGNRMGAIEDLNRIRVGSGGLDPLPLDWGGDLVTELLYNRHYSLVWEWGHTWVDMIRYGRLLQIPVGAGDPRLFDAFPFNVNECLPRDVQPTGCQRIEGVRP